MGGGEGERRRAGVRGGEGVGMVCREGVCEKWRNNGVCF